MHQVITSGKLFGKLKQHYDYKLYYLVNELFVLDIVYFKKLCFYYIAVVSFSTV